MRLLTCAEDLKVTVYEALTAPDTVITINDENKWEIQIMREDSLVFDTTDELMENIQTNLEETPHALAACICVKPNSFLLFCNSFIAILYLRFYKCATHILVM